ncbi:MAG: hypothetical protein ABJH05_02240 [Fulvivirga sp.]
MNLTHNFYKKTEKQQKLYYAKVIVLLVCILLTTCALIYATKFYLLVCIVPFIILLFAPFLDTPKGITSGTLQYQSPLLITQDTQKKIIIHGGTLFDYFFVLNNQFPKSSRKKIVIIGYLRGLLNLIAAYEMKRMDDRPIEGTSYIINQRTAEKIGLSPTTTNAGQYLILILNYLVLMISYSYVNGKLSFPKLSEIKTYKGSISNIAERKQFIQDLEKFLTQSISDATD